MNRLIFETEHDLFRDSARKFFRKETEPHRNTWNEGGQVNRNFFSKSGSSEVKREIIAPSLGLDPREKKAGGTAVRSKADTVKD